MYSDQDKKFSICRLSETSMSSKRNINDDCDGAHLTSFGIETEEEKSAIIKSCLTVCRSIEKRRGVVSVAGV